MPSSECWNLSRFPDIPLLTHFPNVKPFTVGIRTINALVVYSNSVICNFTNSKLVYFLLVFSFAQKLYYTSMVSTFVISIYGPNF